MNASLSGHYQFPDNTQLVSGVYVISVNGKLFRPVTLGIQHCVCVQPSHKPSSLSIVAANINQKTLPYNFEPMAGGIFSANRGVINLELSSESLLFAIVQNKSSPEEVTKKYYAMHTYYIPRTPTSWLVHLPVFLDLELMHEVNYVL